MFYKIRKWQQLSLCLACGMVAFANCASSSTAPQASPGIAPQPAGTAKMPAASAAGGTTSGDISRPLEPAPANDWRSELSEEEEQYAEEQYTRAPRNYEKPRTITSLFVII